MHRLPTGLFWARLLLVALVLTALTAVGVAVLQVATRDPAPRLAALSPAQRAAARADAAGRAVLSDWDARRAQAWAGGDPAALRALYADGSVAGRRDAAMLRAWTARGLRVQGMRMQVLALDVRRRSPRRLVLLVTDRLARAVAVGPGVRHELPRDAPTTRTVELVRVGRTPWLVAAVRPARQPAAQPAR